MTPSSSSAAHLLSTTSSALKIAASLSRQTRTTPVQNPGSGRSFEWTAVRVVQTVLERRKSNDWQWEGSLSPPEGECTVESKGVAVRVSIKFPFKSAFESVRSLLPSNCSDLYSTQSIVILSPLFSHKLHCTSLYLSSCPQVLSKWRMSRFKDLPVKIFPLMQLSIASCVASFLYHIAKYCCRICETGFSMRNSALVPLKPLPNTSSTTLYRLLSLISATHLNSKLPSYVK